MPTLSPSDYSWQKPAGDIKARSHQRFCSGLLELHRDAPEHEGSFLSAGHSRLRFRPEFGYRKDSNTTPSLVQLQVTVASAACVLCLQHFLRPEQHIESLTAFANPDSSEKKSTEFGMTAAQPSS